MKKRAFIAIAAIGGLLAAGACTKKGEAPADTAGTAAMTDTGTAGAYTTPPAPTMSDTTAAGTSGASATKGSTSGMTGSDTIKGRASGDTTTKK